MNYTRNFTITIFLSALCFPCIVHAVSYSSIATQEEKAAKGIREVGENVCLFHSGTADVKREIHNNDVLVVYRETASRRLVQVGKIKVLSFAGTDYFNAKVVEGEVMTGDIAKKGNAASLVISSVDKCN